MRGLGVALALLGAVTSWGSAYLVAEGKEVSLNLEQLVAIFDQGSRYEHLIQFFSFKTDADRVVILTPLPSRPTVQEIDAPRFMKTHIDVGYRAFEDQLMATIGTTTVESMPPIFGTGDYQPTGTTTSKVFDSNDQEKLFEWLDHLEVFVGNEARAWIKNQCSQNEYLLITSADRGSSSGEDIDSTHYRITFPNDEIFLPLATLPAAEESTWNGTHLSIYAPGEAKLEGISELSGHYDEVYGFFAGRAKKKEMQELAEASSMVLGDPDKYVLTFSIMWRNEDRPVSSNAVITTKPFVARKKKFSWRGFVLEILIGSSALVMGWLLFRFVWNIQKQKAPVQIEREPFIGSQEELKLDGLLFLDCRLRCSEAGNRHSER
ncbi:MAG: hypothetical protein R2688_02085 [Fimbriimonadaceae bacterium]